MNEIIQKLTNCMDCDQHFVIPDPDPYDSFCDDDVAVLCKLTKKNSGYKKESPYWADQQQAHESVTVSCRPHHMRAECEIPNWCPKLKEQNQTAEIDLTKVIIRSPVLINEAESEPKNEK